MRKARAGQTGSSLVEVAIFVAILAPLMVALAMTVSVFRSTAETGHHLATATAENKKVLDRIAGELLQSTTRRDHADVGTPLLPQPQNPAPEDFNTAYDFPPSTFGTLHETTARDGFEYWHAPQTTRRFFIYTTYEPFDTLEYQKIRTPLDEIGMAGFITGPNQVSQPWSTSRKIFLEDGKVLLRVRLPDAGAEDYETIVLGTHADDLAFHLNQDGNIIVRLTTASGIPPEGSQEGVTDRGVRLTNQVVVAPRNGLF